MNRMRILLVEDERLIRVIMAEALCDAGYEVIEAEDGKQAICILEAADGVDLLLTDMQMPGADGNAVAARAKQIFPGLPVIYATGRPETLTNPVGHNDAVIRKPFGPAAILALAPASAGRPVRLR